MSRARYLVIALALVAAASPRAMQRTLSGLTIDLRGEPAQPGAVLDITVTASGALHDLAGTAFGRPVAFVADASGRTWHGLAGVDVAQASGQASVTVRAHGEGGAPLTASKTVAVAPRRFATRSLQVASQFVEPSAAEVERIRAESERLEAIFKVVSRQTALPQFALPIPGVPGSNFGTRSVFNGQPRAPHAGVDFRGSVGTPIAAPATGRVVLAEPLFFTGNTVVIDHGLGLYSLLAHLSRIDVTVGQAVDRGAVVGLLGATGRVTGPHLHWAVRLGSARVDALRVVALLGAVE
jgi:murein DD-endopeptidase MepM/ murein hydrolase activator NlpD